MSLVIKSEKRDLFGKNASRRIRKSGLVPAILYGEGAESLPLVLAKKDIVKIMKSETRENTIFKIAYDSEEKDVMIKALQIDATSDELLHADLILIAMNKAIRVSVPIELLGEPVGVKTEGGFVDFMTREVEIECLPADIPERISADISGLHLHQSLKVADITAPAGVKLISEPSTVLVLVQVPHEEKVEAKPEEEVVAAEAAAAAPAEPEVIKKERKKEEGEEK
ncbi:MAG: 50S ribosomal protein L25 [Candidatus Aminicenantes bacterium]|nr:50S ribosomal protein L25 [Candidatus Aminicenantes bacterium]